MKALRKYVGIRLLLSPFALFYGFISGLRNFFFDHRLVRIARFNIPVVSIGNITAGGSGKTPFLMLCLELLQKRYNHIVVVSRGYGRQSKGLRIVSDGRSRVLTAAEGGDEPVLIARRFPQTAVIVSEKRAAGIKKAIEQFGAELILLDDGFQHRWVDRSADIVLISGDRELRKEHLLPVGDLRERITNIKRADIIVINQSAGRLDDRDKERLKMVYKGPLFTCEFTTAGLIDRDWRLADYIETLQTQNVLAFCAIANPDQFRKTLKFNQITPARFMAYPDHFAYTTKTFEEIIVQAKEAGCTAIVTTEKDLVKIDTDSFAYFSLFAVRLQGRIDDTESFLDKLYQFIDNGN